MLRDKCNKYLFLYLNFISNNNHKLNGKLVVYHTIIVGSNPADCI